MITAAFLAAFFFVVSAGAEVPPPELLWVPAVNNHGGFGRWAFLEIDDPWNAKNAIQAGLQIGATP